MVNQQDIFDSSKNDIVNAVDYGEFKRLLAASECRLCPLCEGRNSIVVDRGDPGARIMAVGEAPGREEDAKGLAFVGRAGKLLGGGRAARRAKAPPHYHAACPAAMEPLEPRILLSAGDLDPTFGNGGMVTTDTYDPSWPADDIGRAVVAVQADGKLVVAGQSFDSDTATDFALARYNADGSLDSSFGEDGKVMTDFGSRRDTAYALASSAPAAIRLRCQRTRCGAPRIRYIPTATSSTKDRTDVQLWMAM